MSPDSDALTVGRRTVIAGLLAAGGTAVAGGLAIGDTEESTAQTADRPALDWRQRSDAPKSVFQSVVQTDDGGYALAGSGIPSGADESSPDQFVLTKTSGDGTREWLTFASDDTDTTGDCSFFDLVQTSDGGFVLVGDATDPLGEDRIGGKVAEAVKISASGDVEWVKRLDAFESDERSDSDTGHSDNAIFLTALAGADGSVLAGGTFEGGAWLVSLDSAGSVAWERTYDGFSVAELRARTDGFQAVVDGEDTYRGLRLDAEGRVSESVTLDIDYEKTPYNHRFACTSDGGYAYTGRDRDRENMVLAFLADDGTRRWRTEYDGPSNDSDWADHVIETDDGGYALGGYMRDDGAFVPAIVRAGEDGTERWRWLFTESDADDVADIVATADGGYACLLGSGTNTLVKLGPEPTSGDSPTTTPTDEPPTETEQTPAETTPGSETPPDTTRVDGTPEGTPPRDNSTGTPPFGVDEDELGECGF